MNGKAVTVDCIPARLVQVAATKKSLITCLLPRRLEDKASYNTHNEANYWRQTVSSDALCSVLKVEVVALVCDAVAVRVAGERALAGLAGHVLC